MRLFKKKKRVLVLGGGSARGLCNIGVLRVMERYFGRDNLPFDMIIGTSIGSLIGAAYSMGMTVDELEEMALGFAWPKLVDLGLYSTGLIKGDKLETIINDCVDEGKFSDMRIPFALTTTDIETGEELIHDSGDLVKLIRASCSWPGIFSAVQIDGRLLVDGGVRNSVPTKMAYQNGATFVVAVNPGFAVKNQKINNLIQVVIQTVQIMGEELNSYQSEVADIAIKPDLKDIDQFEFEKAGTIIREGELAAEASIKKLKRKWNRLR
ncbi:MAG: patatin-like phospholipase family protein [Candidatus Omnitrophota bacterium]|nr:patatin-like phospholipase family protein [Candidatus Omnitrophota bacterium]